MKVSIIKYNAGNTQSVLFALERLGVSATVTNNPDELNTSDKIIFPGVGEASSAMQYLKEKKLDHVIRNLKQPLLGICLGMQLLCDYSEEGNTPCLGVFNVKVKKFSRSSKENTEKIKVPQIGWNTIDPDKSQFFKDIHENDYLYFVHSYFAELCSTTIAKSNYGLTYSSALQKNNFYGVQFHPEKSGRAGEQLLKNFFNLT